MNYYFSGLISNSVEIVGDIKMYLNIRIFLFNLEMHVLQGWIITCYI